MKLVIENGTDAACMALYDRAALHADFDAAAREDSYSAIEEAQANGSCFFTHTDGDGEYWLHLYIDEVPPPEVSSFAVDPLETPSFFIPSGKLHYTGGEYMSKEDSELAKKHPDRLKHLDVPPGVYEATFYRTDFSRRVVAQKLKAVLSLKERMLVALPNILALPVLGGILAALVYTIHCRFTLGCLGKLALSIVIGIGLWLSVFAIPAYGRAVDRHDEIRSRFPAIVGILRSKD
jgi:hypothetical protein